jgi:hypothetical protein
MDITAAEEFNVLDDSKEVEEQLLQLNLLTKENRRCTANIERETAQLQNLIEHNKGISNDLMVEERVIST